MKALSTVFISYKAKSSDHQSGQRCIACGNDVSSEIHAIYVATKSSSSTCHFVFCQLDATVLRITVYEITCSENKFYLLSSLQFTFIL